MIDLLLDPAVATAAAALLGLLRRQLPQRRHPPAAADARARLAPRSAPSSRGETRRAAPRYNLVVPRSACPACGHAITALENIPVVSWLALRGKCSACGAAISARYPLVELLGAASSARWRDLAFGPTLQGARGVRLPVDAARADVHRRRHAAPARRPHAAAPVGRPRSPTCSASSCRSPRRSSARSPAT